MLDILVDTGKRKEVGSDFVTVGDIFAFLSVISLNLTRSSVRVTVFFADKIHWWILQKLLLNTVEF